MNGMSQCDCPSPIFFQSNGKYYDNNIIEKSNSRNFSHFISRDSIDKKIEILATYILRDSVWFGVTVVNGENYSITYTIIDSKMEGEIFAYFVNGMKISGTCDNDTCSVKEYYPNGELFQEYKSISFTFLTGSRVVYNKDGTKICTVENRVYDWSPQNYRKYAAGKPLNQVIGNGIFLGVSDEPICY
jgi:antitoxin component YwqK of YwqJK toxin-antitoxin module